MTKRIAVMQMTSGIDPEANRNALEAAVERAADGGALMLFTPEMSGLLDQDRSRAAKAIVREEQDETLAAMRAAARRRGIWIALGSLAVVREDGGWANRAFVIDDKGEIAARYDKIHMFDAELGEGESWHESSAYTAGDRIVTVETPLGRLGLSICYDIRFPALYHELGLEKCDLIAIPAAFTAQTGKAHWHLLQRARAVESSAFVVAAAQVGKHEDGRRTYGHSLVADPWGEVVLDMGDAGAELAFADIDIAMLTKIRRQLPSLANRRAVLTSYDK